MRKNKAKITAGNINEILKLYYNILLQKINGIIPTLL